MSTLDITYRFNFGNANTHQYSLQLDPVTLELISDFDQVISKWKRLEFNQCPNCPLDPQATPLCPVTNNLDLLVNNCDKLHSHNEVFLEVITSERVISEIGRASCRERV